MNYKNMRSSEICCRGLNLAEGGTPSKEKGLCSWCGKTINVGDNSGLMVYGAGFCDGDAIERNSTGRLLCGWCVNVKSKTIMMNAPTCFATEKHVYRIKRTEWRKWVLENIDTLAPTGTSFAVWFVTAKSGHLIWRTRPSQSPDYFTIQIGARNMVSVRMPAVRKALKIGQRLVEEGILQRPCIVKSSTTLKNLNHGEVLHFAKTGMTESEKQFANTLTAGECWCIATMASDKPAVKPPDVDLNPKPKKETSQLPRQKGGISSITSP